MTDLYDPAFPTLDDNQLSEPDRNGEHYTTMVVTTIKSVPPKMDDASFTAASSSEIASTSEDGSGLCRGQVILNSSCKDIITFSNESHGRDNGFATMLVRSETQTFNGQHMTVNTTHEDQGLVPSGTGCVETYSSNSAPIDDISSMPADGGDVNVNSTHSASSSSVPNVNTVVEEIVEAPLELVKNSIDCIPVVAGECIVETDNVLEVDQCTTLSNSEKKEKQTIAADDTGIRRSSRIAEKKNQKHQKSVSENPKPVKESEAKDKVPEPTAVKVSSSDSEVSKGSRHYNKEKSGYRHKSSHSYGKRDERDYVGKSRRDNLDRHEHKRFESSRRESNRRDVGSRRYSHRSESSKSDCDRSSKDFDKESNRSVSSKDCNKEGSRSLSSKDCGSKGSSRYRSRGQQSYSSRKISSETSEIKNASFKYEEAHSDDQQKQKQVDADKSDECDNLCADLPKYKGKFLSDVKVNADSNQAHGSVTEVKSAVVAEESKNFQKKIVDDHITLKPEKVKSRWRRSSELEHGDLSASVVSGFSESTCQRSPDFSQKKESLAPIAEEQPSTSICAEKPTNLEEQKERPPHYEPIENNIYLFERKKSKSKKEVRRMVCDCTLTEEEKAHGEFGCTENCLNRLLMIECGSRCAAGDLCSNKRFQKRQFMKMEPFKTEKKGWGLRVLEDVAAGQFVMEYVGEVLSPQDFKQRVKQYAKEKNNHYYFMALKCDEIIDATNKGNLSRFINHSCSPNCETQKWTVNGELRIGFFTRGFVNAGDELTFDYQFQRYGRSVFNSVLPPPFSKMTMSHHIRAVAQNKEAQKCYCQSLLCRGFIGDEKQISLDNYSSSKSSSRRKKSSGEKKREILEDFSLEEELEKLQLSGGLRNREDTLVLARLMVRADDVHTRHRLLNIILNTTEMPCLRLFLDYHGLSSIWSWTADVVDLDLKTKILKALAVLPIPNKTMLLDSKVINVVEKWCIHHSGRKSELDKDSEVTETEQSSDSPSGGTTPCGGDDVHDPSFKKARTCENNEGDTNVSSYLRLRASDSIMFPASTITTVNIKPSNTPSPTKSGSDEQKGSNYTIRGNTSAIGSTSSYAGKVGNDGMKPIDAVTKSDEESGDTMDEEEDRKNDAELSNLASQLLDSWSGLKEVFRIPRVEQQKRREDEDAADHRNNERECSSRNRDYGSQEHSFKEKDGSKDRDSQDSDHFFVKDKKYRDKWRDREKSKDTEHHHERSVPESHDWRDEKSFPKHSKKIRLAEPEVQQPPRPRKVLLPTPPRLTKEERRQLFALEVQQKDQEEALRKQQEERSCAAVVFPPTTETTNYTSFNQYFDPNQYDAAYSGSYHNPYDPNTPYHQPLVPDCQTTVDIGGMTHNVALLSEPKHSVMPSTRTALLPTPTYVEPSVQALPLPVPSPQYPEQPATLPYPPPGLLMQPPPTQMPFIGAPPPTLTQPAPVLNHAPAGTTPVTAPIAGMSLLPHPTGPPNVPGINPVTPAIASPTAVPLNAVSCSQPEAVPLASSALEACASPSGPVSGPQANVPPAFLPNSAQFVNTSNRPVYFVHSSSTTSVVNVRDQITIQQAIPVSQLPSLVPEGKFTSSAKPSVVRLPPNWKTARDPEGNIYYYHAITRQTQWDPPTLEEIEDMDLGTPTIDEPKQSKKKSTTTAAADTSSELAKKIKELFRAKMSTFIVQCLNPYRKPDCQVGRIASSDDFKHLARKLTHSVMAKELKHCKNVEDLECNDNVKMKAKDFTQKYMAKQGPVYKKESSSKCN